MPDDAVVTGSLAQAGTDTTTTATPDWYETLTPDLKVDKTVQSYKGKPFNDVVKSLVDLNRLNGASIRLPKPDASPEDREAFMADLSTKLGRPATAGDYKKAMTLEALPEGTPWDEGAFDEFLTEMHKAHATPAQTAAAANAYRRILGRGMANQAKLYTETEAALKSEWGGQYDRKLTIASQAALEIGGKDYVALLESKGIANHPLVLKAHAAYGETLVEQKLISGDLPGEPTENDAQSKLQSIYNDKTHPYHQGDPKAVDEVYRLTQRAMGAAGRKVVSVMG